VEPFLLEVERMSSRAGTDVEHIPTRSRDEMAFPGGPPIRRQEEVARLEVRRPRRAVIGFEQQDQPGASRQVILERPSERIARRRDHTHPTTLVPSNRRCIANMRVRSSIRVLSRSGVPGSLG
jgi:hypothetical protein